MLAIIGGSGLNQLSGFSLTYREVVRTPYGEPSGPLLFGILTACPLVFLARHGADHTIAPHRINYRANIWALKQAGVDNIVAIATVGGIRQEFSPGSLIVPDQLLDYTWGRKSTFFDDDDGGVHHIDFSYPFTAEVRQRILQAAKQAGELVFDGGTYATTQGPRLESIAEIKRFLGDGADLVGMTAMPEAALAREMELGYGLLNLVVNYAAGRGEQGNVVSLEEIRQVLRETVQRVERVLVNL